MAKWEKYFQMRASNAQKELSDFQKYDLDENIPDPAAAERKSTSVAGPSSSCSDDVIGRSKRPLVLFFSWLGARERGIDKYCELYQSRGLDVLVVRGKTSHFLRPAKGRRLAHALLEHLSRSPEYGQPILVHAISIGAFIFSICQLEMEENASKFRSVEKRFCGLIFDSMVMGSMNEMVHGLAVTHSRSAIHRALIKASAHSYFFVSKRFTVNFYDKVTSTFLESLVTIPVLVFYSLDDSMCCPETANQMLEGWMSKGRDVTSQCWEHSVHACHLREHAEEYKAALNHFLNKLSCDVPNQSHKSR